MKKMYITPSAQCETFYTQDIITASSASIKFEDAGTEEKGLVRYDADNMDLD